jgi:hypothetical protein
MVMEVAPAGSSHHAAWGTMCKGRFATSAPKFCRDLLAGC